MPNAYRFMGQSNDEVHEQLTISSTWLRS